MGKINNVLYEPGLRHLFIEVLLKRRITNKLVGKFANTRASKLIIPKFQKLYRIDRSKFKIPPRTFQTLNEFFTREYKDEILKKAFNKNKKGLLVSPAEGFLSLQENINPSIIIQAKGKTYRLSELICENSSKMDQKFFGGTLLRIRLTPKEYHHCHHLDDGRIIGFKDIKGKYYTSDYPAINKVKKVFCKSHRDITAIRTKSFGNVIYVEIGATFVGSIVQNNKIGDFVRFGDKKSCFKFGGSTIILVFERNRIKIRDDILRATKGNREIYVELGEVLGRRA